MENNQGTLDVLIDDENQTKMYRNITQGRWNKQDPNWQRLSPLLKDIICKLLLVDPGARISAKDSLEHPWIKGVCFPAHQKPGMKKADQVEDLWEIVIRVTVSTCGPTITQICLKMLMVVCVIQSTNPCRASFVKLVSMTLISSFNSGEMFILHVDFKLPNFF